MKRISTLLLIVFLISCQNEKNNSESINNEIVENIEESKKLILKIDLETSVPEDMKLMAINTFLNNGQFLDLYVTQKLNANETSKKIIFELPENITPDNFVGVSFGAKELKEVKINNIILSFGDLEYNIDSKSILSYFKTNQFVDYDEASGIFKTKRVDGQHNPILILRKLYIDKIQEVK